MQLIASPLRHGSVLRISSTAQPRARRVHVVHAKSAAYVSPSSRTGATELEALERFTEVRPASPIGQVLLRNLHVMNFMRAGTTDCIFRNGGKLYCKYTEGAPPTSSLPLCMQIVPDVVLCQTPTKIEEAKAGTASRSVLAGIMVRMNFCALLRPPPKQQYQMALLLCTILFHVHPPNIINGLCRRIRVDSGAISLLSSKRGFFKRIQSAVEQSEPLCKLTRPW